MALGYIDDIKNRLDMATVIARLTGGEAKRMVSCPLPGHGPQTGKTPPLSVNYERKVFKCHGCKKGGSVLDLVGYYFIPGYDKKRTADVIRAAQIAEKEFLGSAAPAVKQIVYHEKETQELSVSLADISRWAWRMENQPEIIRWLEARGCEQWREFGIGYTGRDKTLEKWAHNKIAIPHQYQGKIEAVKLRGTPVAGGGYASLTGSHYERPYNVECLFARPAIVVIVETELDAIAVQSLAGVCAIAFPANLSEDKASKFLRELLFVDRILMIPDNDQAGRDLALLLMKYIPRIGIYYLPNAFKDVGDYVTLEGTLPASFLKMLGNA